MTSSAVFGRFESVVTGDLLYVSRIPQSLPSNAAATHATTTCLTSAMYLPAEADASSELLPS